MSINFTFYIYVLANFADTAITRYTVGTGQAYEANPVVACAMAHLGPTMGLMVTATGATILVALISQRYPRVPSIAAIIHILAFIFNITQIA